MQLPTVYTKAYHMTLLVMNNTRKFPKPYRPTIGQGMEKASIDLVVKLRIALMQKNNTNLRPILPIIDELKVLIQLSYDLKLISHNNFSELGEAIISVGKIIGSMSFRCQKK